MSVRTKNVRISKAKDAVVASWAVISPESPASLWQALKSSQLVEAALCITPQNSADQKYLEALAEIANSWDTCQQILLVMVDLIPYSVIQRFIPGITEYKIKGLAKPSEDDKDAAPNKKYVDDLEKNF